MLIKPKKKLNVNLQHLKNRSFMRFLIKWNDYLEDEASWELENEFRETCPNFVIEDNDLIEEGRSGMDWVENGILRMMEIVGMNVQG